MTKTVFENGHFLGLGGPLNMEFTQKQFAKLSKSTGSSLTIGVTKFLFVISEGELLYSDGFEAFLS